MADDQVKRSAEPSALEPSFCTPEGRGVSVSPAEFPRKRAYARTRSPDGSYRGSWTISAGIHSPNRHTSAAVPASKAAGR